MYKKVTDCQVFSLEHINNVPRLSFFQYEFNRGGLVFLLANKEVRMSGSNCFLFFLASARVSGWQLVTKTATVLAIFL